MSFLWTGFMIMLKINKNNYCLIQFTVIDINRLPQ